MCLKTKHLIVLIYYVVKLFYCVFLIHLCQRLKDLINDNKFDTATKSAFGGIFFFFRFAMFFFVCFALCLFIITS